MPGIGIAWCPQRTVRVGADVEGGEAPGTHGDGGCLLLVDVLFSFLLLGVAIAMMVPRNSLVDFSRCLYLVSIAPVLILYGFDVVGGMALMSWTRCSWYRVDLLAELMVCYRTCSEISYDRPCSYMKEKNHGTFLWHLRKVRRRLIRRYLCTSAPPWPDLWAGQLRLWSVMDVGDASRPFRAHNL
ncbi:uncharacterized protein B0I36DRAFT_318740 [Microdochium trichocladiopsis]|uniref:Uncharacterized protein n=1 Tax=Microdochium trichocladiopsis TaxID=1682393 RepID=A0A9P8YC87_9PEZI|nr:uncharacterized protein B0I36DRAFT_318740 [Microdochium trichocladiopsis]KAH7035617.1 hypothetical protein B0I36DRAFT_318740 [Microdochium trichocladiopsis]